LRTKKRGNPVISDKKDKNGRRPADNAPEKKEEGKKASETIPILKPVGRLNRLKWRQRSQIKIFLGA
jgi:hypothetical protein